MLFRSLVDVDEQCGPFSYIPRTHPFGSDAGLGGALAEERRISDEAMQGVFSPDRWKVCTGPANTMILADTLGYHRGGRPTRGQRILITFTYTSGTPITDPPIAVTSIPSWVSTDMQRAAVKPLLSTGAHT